MPFVDGWAVIASWIRFSTASPSPKVSSVLSFMLRVSTTTPGGVVIFAGDARGVGLVDVRDIAGLVAEDDGLIDLDAVDAYDSGGDARVFGSSIDVVDTV